ncbi:MAG: MDR family MFS transporter, partial [Vicinamibacterales bacterium]
DRMRDAHGTLSISLGRRRAITAGLLLGMSLGALEATVVSTAMPTVIAQLGGLAHYSWVFSAYLLTSTASVPIWGRLSDLYGRRRLYLAGVTIFLGGSALCGAAGSMTQLIVFRAIQGLGAGAIIPLGMTIVGELYSIEERPRIQALFSGIWGVASIGGPLVGGYITDVLSWPWVFYLNLPFGALAMGVIAATYPPARPGARVGVDWLGAALLFGSVTALLVALSGATTAMWAWLLAAGGLAAALAAVERRVREPILPLDLFADRTVSRTLLVAFLVGTAMFGAIAFLPLFVQAVMGGTATEAGSTLTPLFLGWVLSSIAGARLSLRIGYRRVTATGVALIAAGFGALALMGVNATRTALLANALVLGSGMGLSMLALLLAIQHGVERSRLGLATSLNQFARSIGAAVGVAVMGALLAHSMSGLDLDAHGLAAGSLKLDGSARVQLASALQQVFALSGAMTLLALAACAFLPRVDFTRGVPANAGEVLIEAEMTTLEPQTEPECVEH